MRPRKCDTQNSLGFSDTIRSTNLGQTTKPSDSQQKTRTCGIVDFAILADHRVKLKENEKRDKYLDLAEELKKNYVTFKFFFIINKKGELAEMWTLQSQLTTE